MKNKLTLSKILLLVVVSLSFAQCSKISSLIAELTSVDCDNYLLQEIDSSLSESCRDLTGYLDQNTDSLTSVAQALPVNDLADSKAFFVQLTDDAGDTISNVDLEDVTVAVSTDEGQTYDDITAESIQTLSEIDTNKTSILFNLDYSGSILDSDLDDINSGLSLFFNTLTALYQGAVIKFSTDVDLLQDFTETESEITTIINDTSYTREYTSLYDAIYDGVDALKEETTPLRLMILFTDGIDNDSDHTKDEVISYAQQNNIPVCIVGVGFADVSTLQEIASDTGCFFIYKQFFSDLDDSFEAFANQINDFKMISLPDSFIDTSGILKITTDVGEETAREFTQSF